ncbi:LOW QUALITY PROTEIN: hypothetical protein HZS_1635 [Henneguya salminicola]|nr:LOW QUALITY PROTEIN: hypothetical protein HZS_1635 [Henneguya salminicola]
MWGHSWRHYHQMLIWITDECLSLLRYNGPTFIDGTFRSTPSPFKQCVIIMTFDSLNNFTAICFMN